METGKYDKITAMLRKSVPDPGSLDGIENSIISRISQKQRSSGYFSNLTDFLFGWVYISWVRRSLVAASFVLLAIFVWQQNYIMNQVEYLGKQINNRITKYDPSVALEKKLILYKSRSQVMVPEEDLNRLLDSLKSTQNKYRDIMNLIDSDPILKRAVEEKLKKNMGSKFNL
jgi:hypothetical protein